MGNATSEKGFTPLRLTLLLLSSLGNERIQMCRNEVGGKCTLYCHHQLATKSQHASEVKCSIRLCKIFWLDYCHKLHSFKR